MRPIEILLVLTNLLTFLALAVQLPHELYWMRYLALIALLIAGVQTLVEGARWQMVPAYVMTGLFFLVWLIQSLAPAGRNIGQRWINSLAVGLGILGLTVSIALPVILPVFRIPRPSGTYEIGTLTYHLVDTNRPEIYTADPDDRRELMVQVWYPAKGDPSAQRARYVQDGSILAPVARLLRLPDFLFTHLKYVTTNAIPSAPVADNETRYPVVLFSHGRAGFRSHNTLQVEELASYGYIVVTIDHPYAAAGVIFPDGRVATFDSRMYDPEHVGHPAFLDEVIAFLAQDAIFTLEQLAEINQADSNGILTGRLDLGHVGMFGSSLGGLITAEACLLEPRLQACLAMDVFMPPDVVREGLQQPTMWISRDAATMQREGWAQEDIDETVSTIRATFEGLPGDGYLVLVPGMYHNDFSDAWLFSPLASRIGLTGPIDGRRTRSILNAYTVAFFDRHLKGLPATLLDGPAEGFPEVLIETRRP